MVSRKEITMQKYTITYTVFVSDDADPSSLLDGATETRSALIANIEATCDHAVEIDESTISVSSES